MTFPRRVTSRVLLSSCFLCTMGLAQFALVAVCSGAEPAADSPAVVQTQKIRQLVTGGRPRQAIGLLNQAWENPAQVVWSPRETAYYLSLCHELLGANTDAQLWLSRSFFSEVAEIIPADRDYFRLLHKLPSSGPSLLAQRGLPASDQTYFVALAVDPVASLREIAKQAADARQDFEKNPKSAADSIRLATWLLMYGEVAAQKHALWTQSLNAFDAGKRQLKLIDEAFDEDPNLEKTLLDQPTLLMRLDAARVRQDKIDARQQLARAEETQRLTQLRTLVRSFGDLSGEQVRAQAFYLAANDEALQASGQAQLTKLTSIKQTLAERKDLFLLSDEPDLLADSAVAWPDDTAAPFSDSSVSLAKSLSALSLFKLAVEGKSPVEWDAAKLQTALTWAIAAGDPQASALADVPAGADAENILAHYVAARASEALGLNLVAKNLSSGAVRQAAQNSFSTAQAELKLVIELIGQSKADNRTAPLLAEAKQMLAGLESSDLFLAKSRQLVSTGQAPAAYEALFAALCRHTDGKLFAERAAVGRQAGIAPAELLAELDQALAAGLLQKNDPNLILARAKIVIEEISQQIASSQWSRLAAPQRQAIAQRLQTESAALQTAAKAAKPNSSLRGQLEAFQALAIAYQGLSGDAATTDKALLRTGYEAAADAQVALQAILADKAQATEEVPAREALVACRLAIGHLAVKLLPEYRDESKLAFAAAMDEMAKLPQGGKQVAVVGSPLLGAVLGRSQQGEGRLVLEERDLRRKLTRFVESTFTLQFGEPAAAADQMAAAYNQAAVDSSSSGSAVNAAELLGAADGFDSQISLTDSLKAFKSLSDVAASRSDVALTELVSMLAPDKAALLTPADADKLSAARLSKAVAAVQSPLLGYALTAALEGRIDALPAGKNSYRELLVQQAQASQKRTGELLASARMAQRYPHLVALNQAAGERLNNADQFRQGLASMGPTQTRAATMKELEKGLKRHPGDEQLWQRLLETQIAAATADATAPENQKLMVLLQTAEADQSVSPFLVNYYRGILQQRTGQSDAALASFTTAKTLAKSAQDRVLVSSKLGLIKATAGL